MDDRSGRRTARNRRHQLEIQRPTLTRTERAPSFHIDSQASRENQAFYQRCPLRTQRDIRIITILPNENPDESVQAEISIWDSASEYEALSYHWGNEEPTKTISIRPMNNQTPSRFWLRPNLEEALRELRYGDEPRKIWVDAICINQGDNVEKNHQVARMSEIFTKASNVCIWLGSEANTDAKLAFEFIRRIVDLRDFDVLFTEERYINEFDAFITLMQRPWFGRRWVVQELALARRATIHCGEQAANWKQFSDAVSLFIDVELRTKCLTEMFRGSKKFNYPPNHLGDARFIGANRFVTATANLFRKSDDGKILRYLLPLETLVSSLTTFDATDPKDTIYAVLAMAQDTASSIQEDLAETDPETRQLMEAYNNAPRGARDAIANLARMVRAPRRFEINYNQSFFRVCRDFIEFILSSSDSLDMICRPWAPNQGTLPGQQPERLPSWIRTLEYAPFGPRGDGKFDRINADPLVGLPGLSRRAYSAAGTTKARWRFPEDPDSHSLFAKGFILDQVASIDSESALGGNVAPSWRTFGGWTDFTADPPEELWRTLIADRGEDGLNPPNYYKLACIYAFGQGVRGAVLNPERLINEGVGTIGGEFLKRMEMVVYNRRLIKTRRYETLGLASNQCHEGDLICILYGCSVPVILRPIRNVNSTPTFSFLGECYVHGFMDGEALERVNLPQSKREFELV